MIYTAKTPVPSLALTQIILAMVCLLSSAGCERSVVNQDGSKPTVLNGNDDNVRRNTAELPREQEKSKKPVPPMSPLRYRESIIAAMKLGNYQQAEQIATDATNLLKKAQLYLLRADAAFMNLDIEGAIDAYDAIIKMQPAQKPYLWQRGLALYYTGQFQAGVEQFESHGTVNATDVENSIWHMLCAAQVDGFTSARKNMISVRGDSRDWSDQVYGLFAGTVAPEDLVSAVPNEDAASLVMTNRYYTNLYLGLYYEMLGEPKKSIEAMRRAVQCNPYQGDILMGQIARIHLALNAE